MAPDGTGFAMIALVHVVLCTTRGVQPFFKRICIAAVAETIAEPDTAGIKDHLGLALVQTRTS